MSKNKGVFTQIKRLVDSVERPNDDEQSIIRELIDGMIIKCEVKRLSEAASAINNLKKTKAVKDLTAI